MRSLNSMFLKLVFHQVYYQTTVSLRGKKKNHSLYRFSRSSRRTKESVLSLLALSSLVEGCPGFVFITSQTVKGWLGDWISHVVCTPLELALDTCTPEFARLLALGIVYHFFTQKVRAWTRFSLSFLPVLTFNHKHLGCIYCWLIVELGTSHFS